MQVLIVGRELVANRLRPLLASQGVETVEFTSGFGEGDLPAPGERRLALVDSMAPGLESVCRSINCSGGIPLVLVVERGDEVDWSDVERLKASGFVSSSARDPELSARLGAVIRRLAPVG